MSDIINRLVWFELQVCPCQFRLALTPGQPVLVGYGSTGAGQAVTLLIPYEGREQIVDGLANSLEELVRANRILQTPMNAPEQAYAADAMELASLHIRIADASSNRWAAFYPLEKIPPNVQALLDGCQQLGKRMLERSRSTPIAPETATGLVDPRP